MSPARRGRASVAFGVRAAFVLALLGAAPLGAQGLEDLTTRCTTGGGDAARCGLAAAAARDLMGEAALLVGPTSELPGQGSTLGRRLGGSPRIAGFLRTSGKSVGTDVLTDPAADRSSSFVPALHAGIGLGLFDGFHLLPTMGGFLSFDAVAQGTFVFFPEEKGFQGRVDGLSLGARVGILRESFTLPGVTLSFSHRFLGAVQYSETGTGGASTVRVDPAVSSWRATVGKDLFAFGVTGGIGWEDYSGEAVIEVASGGSGPVTRTGDLGGTRTVYFVGLTRQIAVLAWLSAELGWSDAFEPFTAAGASSPDWGSTFHGSLALLVKL